jgi:hypothetical protein
MREEKRKRRQEEATQQELERGGPAEVKFGRNGEQYQIAARYDPVSDKEYVQAVSWDGMERVGGEEWLKKQADREEKYVGYDFCIGHAVCYP